MNIIWIVSFSPKGNEQMNTELMEPMHQPLVITGADKWDLVQRKAMAYSASSMVPKEYQGPKGSQGFANCIIAIEMAERMNAPILQIMQNMDIIHGRPSWRAQFLIATWNQCGRFSAIRYKFTGEKGTDTHGCIAWAIERDTGEVLEGTEITIGMAKKEGWATKAGSKWQSIPEHMLRLRAAAWLVRAYAPELSMGLGNVEEAYDSVEGEVMPSETRRLA
jgi:hypothetical protein